MNTTESLLTRHTDDCCAPARKRESGPLRPGTRVRYRGSIDKYVGRTFRIQACHCWRCWDIGELRYRLYATDRLYMESDGEATAICVRRSSLIRL